MFQITPYINENTKMMLMTTGHASFFYIVLFRLLCKPINAEVTKHNGPALHSVTADLSVGLFELVEAVFDQRHSTASLYGFHLPIENVLPEYTEVSSFVTLFISSSL